MSAFLSADKMQTNMVTLSESTEMYLITIFRLVNKNSEVHVSDIAEMLGLHHSSVSEKLKRLREQDYVMNDEHRLHLTEAGNQIAVNVLRKHRLIKTFLVELIDYPIDEVYDEACRLEHVVSERLINGLEKLMAYPKVDPHGYPIPQSDGTINAIQYRTLNDLTVGDQAIIKRVDALQHEKLTYLKQIGLVPGTQVRVKGIEPFDGPLILDIDHKVIAIAPSLAQEVEVDRLDGVPKTTS